MNFGTQLVVPNGFGSLRSGVRYYFAGCRDDRILLVWFMASPYGWRAYTIHLEKDEFLDACSGQNPVILKSPEQNRMPPWLVSEGEVDYDRLQEFRPGKPKETYRQQAERRLLSITPALQASERILSSKRPLSAITRISKKDGIKENPHRVQLWFFAKILHAGAGIWALKRPSGNVGKWERQSERHADTKFGRPSLIDPKGGHSTARIKEKIIAAYSKHCGLGKTMCSIHRKALVEDFGCLAACDHNGNDFIYHPEGDPFPSYGQFRQVVVDALGLERVQRNVYGDARIRNRKRTHDGTYASQYANLLEDIQMDAYFKSERPRALYSNRPMPRLAVVLAKCVGSAANFGIGFSLEGEAEEAYRAALFCAAVPKDLICRLYGLDPERIVWNMQGLPPSCLSDRGPAGSSALVLDLENRFPIRSAAPSYAPKSKAFVEGGNPKDVVLEGTPSYVQSDLTVPQMMKAAIIDAVRQNNSLDISERLEDAEIDVFLERRWPATPQRLWEHRTEQMRSHARLVSVEQAVRMFLTPISAEVDTRGVKFRRHWYSSKEFRTSGAHEKCLDMSNAVVTVYAVAMTMTLIWLDYKGRLMELTPHKIARVGDEEYEFSVFEAVDIEKMRAKLGSLTRKAGEAAALKAELALNASTGKSGSNGRRVSGTPKRLAGLDSVEARITKSRGKSRSAA